MISWPRGFVAVALAAAVLPAAGVAPARAYVTIGPDYQPDPNASQAINYPSGWLLFNATAPPGIRLLSPIGGVVTGWRVALGDVSAGATVQLRVISPAGGSNYTVWAGGPVETPGPQKAQAMVHGFSANVPIAPGHGIGVVKTHPAGGFLEITQPIDLGNQGWTIGDMESVPPEGGTAAATVFAANGLFRMFSADVEPDGDGDHFGDDSQDRCPDRAGPDRGCPPGALDVPAPVTQVHTIAPLSALASVAPESVVLRRGRGILGARVTCPPQQQLHCVGRLAASTARPASKGRRGAAISLGQSRFSVPAGATQTVDIAVPRRSLVAIAKLRRLRVTVRLSAGSSVQRVLGSR